MEIKLNRSQARLAAVLAALLLSGACGAIFGVAAFVLSDEVRLGQVVAAFAVPLLAGTVIALLIQFGLRRWVGEGELRKVERAGPETQAMSAAEVAEAAAEGKRRANRVYRLIFAILAATLAVGLNALGFFFSKDLTIRILAYELGAGMFFLAGYWLYRSPRARRILGGIRQRLATLTFKAVSNFDERRKWEVLKTLSSVSVFLTLAFFVGAVVGPVIGYFILDQLFWFPDEASLYPLEKVVALGMSYLVFGLLALALYFWGYRDWLRKHVPSNGWVVSTILFPVLVMLSFFFTKMLSVMFHYIFTPVWILYLILAAVITMVFTGKTGVWYEGWAGWFVATFVFLVSFVAGGIVLSLIGAAFGMFGQGALIVGLLVTLGWYLSSE